MGTDPVADPGHADSRLADFKLLLPLGPGVRALVLAIRERAFVAHLADEVGRLDLVLDGAVGAPDQAQVRRLQAPEGLYDLVFADDASAARHLAPGGVLCQFLGGAAAVPPDDLTPLGRWRAYPDWPAFRALIPESAAGWWAAAHALRLYPRHSLLNLWARLRPDTAAARLPERGLALYRRHGGTPKSTLLDALRGALARNGHDPILVTPEDRWLLLSGRLGPGNPILAVSLDAEGRPERLIKAARVPGARHLADEAEQIDAVVWAVGHEDAARIIRPGDAVQVEGRWALAYDYEPTAPFFGVRWRLQGRPGLCLTMTDWLARIGWNTRRQDARARIEQRHLDPLRRLVARRLLPHSLQHRAEAALHVLEQLAPTLQSILEHGDLGTYNLRLRRPDGSDVGVLDWGSSTFEGIPLGDLAYLLCSARAPRSLASRCIEEYLVRMRIPLGEAPAFWFSYLARRWEELDGIRPPTPGDPHSGGGLLLPIARRVDRYLQALGA